MRGIEVQETHPHETTRPQIEISTEVAPLVAIGGLFTIKRLAEWYGPLLESDDSTDLDVKNRFIAPANRGIDEPERLIESVVEDLQDIYDRVKRRLYVAGHSLGGWLAEAAALECPEIIEGVASHGGVHAGYKEIPTTFALRHLLGDPDPAKHLKHNSPYMQNHQERMANEWPENMSLLIVSTPFDELIIPPQGFDIELPDGRKPEKRLIIPRLPGAEWTIRHGLGIQDDVEMIPTLRLVEHVNLPRSRAVINSTNEIRLGRTPEPAEGTESGLSPAPVLAVA